jgi:hypothetical protein
VEAGRNLLVGRRIRQQVARELSSVKRSNGMSRLNASITQSRQRHIVRRSSFS